MQSLDYLWNRGLIMPIFVFILFILVFLVLIPSSVPDNQININCKHQLSYSTTLSLNIHPSLNWLNLIFSPAVFATRLITTYMPILAFIIFSCNPFCIKSPRNFPEIQNSFTLSFLNNQQCVKWKCVQLSNITCSPTAKYLHLRTYDEKYL